MITGENHTLSGPIYSSYHIKNISKEKLLVEGQIIERQEENREEKEHSLIEKEKKNRTSLTHGKREKKNYKTNLIEENVQVPEKKSPSKSDHNQGEVTDEKNNATKPLNLRELLLQKKSYSNFSVPPNPIASSPFTREQGLLANLITGNLKNKSEDIRDRDDSHNTGDEEKVSRETSQMKRPGSGKSRYLKHKEKEQSYLFSHKEKGRKEFLEYIRSKKNREKTSENEISDKERSCSDISGTGRAHAKSFSPASKLVRTPSVLPAGKDTGRGTRELNISELDKLPLKEKPLTDEYKLDFCFEDKQKKSLSSHKLDSCFKDTQEKSFPDGHKLDACFKEKHEESLITELRTQQNRRGVTRKLDRAEVSNFLEKHNVAQNPSRDSKNGIKLVRIDEIQKNFHRSHENFRTRKLESSELSYKQMKELMNRKKEKFLSGKNSEGKDRLIAGENEKILRKYLTGAQKVSKTSEFDKKETEKGDVKNKKDKTIETGVKTSEIDKKDKTIKSDVKTSEIDKKDKTIETDVKTSETGKKETENGEMKDKKDKIINASDLIKQMDEVSALYFKEHKAKYDGYMKDALKLESHISSINSDLAQLKTIKSEQEQKGKKPTEYLNKLIEKYENTASKLKNQQNQALENAEAEKNKARALLPEEARKSLSEAESACDKSGKNVLKWNQNKVNEDKDYKNDIDALQNRRKKLLNNQANFSPGSQEYIRLEKEIKAIENNKITRIQQHIDFENKYMEVQNQSIKDRKNLDKIEQSCGLAADILHENMTDEEKEKASAIDNMYAGDPALSRNLNKIKQMTATEELSNTFSLPALISMSSRKEAGGQNVIISTTDDMEKAGGIKEAKGFIEGNRIVIANNSQKGVIAHEGGHKLWEGLSKEEQSVIEKEYEKYNKQYAGTPDGQLDSIALQDKEEYFAEGVRKFHGGQEERAKLKEDNPSLYAILERMEQDGNRQDEIWAEGNEAIAGIHNKIHNIVDFLSPGGNIDPDKVKKEFTEIKSMQNQVQQKKSMMDNLMKNNQNKTAEEIAEDLNKNTGGNIDETLGIKKDFFGALAKTHNENPVKPQVTSSGGEIPVTGSSKPTAIFTQQSDKHSSEVVTFFTEKPGSGQSITNKDTEYGSSNASVKPGQNQIYPRPESSVLPDTKYPGEVHAEYKQKIQTGQTASEQPKVQTASEQPKVQAQPEQTRPDSQNQSSTPAIRSQLPEEQTSAQPLTVKTNTQTQPSDQFPQKDMQTSPADNKVDRQETKISTNEPAGNEKQNTNRNIEKTVEEERKFSETISEDSIATKEEQISGLTSEEILAGMTKDEKEAGMTKDEKQAGMTKDEKQTGMTKDEKQSGITKDEKQAGMT
ncbi:MAG: hypothetical protein ABRQ39_07345, partial [Candidatus Eremiobacterota bacterium]